MPNLNRPAQTRAPKEQKAAEGKRRVAVAIRPSASLKAARPTRPRHPLPPVPRAILHRAADFLGQSKDGIQTLAETALDFLSVPDKVLADNNRYLTVTGCVFRFCPCARHALGRPQRTSSSRRLQRHRLDQRQQNSRPARRRVHLVGFQQPPHRPRPHSRSADPQRRTLDRASPARQQRDPADPNAILVDPDGTPHQIKPAAIGANTFTLPPTEQKAQP